MTRQDPPGFRGRVARVMDTGSWRVAHGYGQLGLPMPNRRILFEWRRRESNPPRQLGRLGPLPTGQGHARRKVRESNPQGSSLDRFRGGCHRRLA